MTSGFSVENLRSLKIGRKQRFDKSHEVSQSVANNARLPVLPTEMQDFMVRQEDKVCQHRKK